MLWKDVVGHEELFMVSSIGHIKSKRTGKILKAHTNKSGYVTIATRVGGRSGKNLCLRVHRVVAEAFIPNPKYKAEVNHINGIKSDNNLSNLEWASRQENVDHAVSSGLISPSAKLNSRKLSKEDVSEIFNLSSIGGFSQRQISRKFAVHHTTIGRILRKEHYVL